MYADVNFSPSPMLWVLLGVLLLGAAAGWLWVRRSRRFRDPSSRPVVFSLRAGASLDEADQHGSIALQVLDGRVTVRVGEGTIHVGVGEVSVVAPGYPCTVVAVDDSLLLLHLAWPPVPGSSVTA